MNTLLEELKEILEEVEQELTHLLDSWLTPAGGQAEASGRDEWGTDIEP